MPQCNLPAFKDGMDKIKLTFIALLLIFVSCKSEMPNDTHTIASTPSTPSTQANSAQISDSDNLQTDAKAIAKTAKMSIKADDFYYAKKKVDSLLLLFKGYTSYENLHKTSYRSDYQMVIKIPVNNFDKLVYMLESEIGMPDQKSITTEDMTTHIIDLNARLKVKKELEARFYTLLKSATTMKDMLTLEFEIGKIRTDIEQITANLASVQSQIVYSTIHLDLYSLHEMVYVPPSFLEEALESMDGGWQFFKDIILVLLRLWPLVLLCSVLFYIFKNKKKIFTKDEHLVG